MIVSIQLYPTVIYIGIKGFDKADVYLVSCNHRFWTFQRRLLRCFSCSPEPLLPTAARSSPTLSTCCAGAATKNVALHTSTCWLGLQWPGSGFNCFIGVLCCPPKNARTCHEIQACHLHRL